MRLPAGLKLPLEPARPWAAAERVVGAPLQPATGELEELTRAGSSKVNNVYSLGHSISLPWLRLRRA